jgi:hypothetical protein
MRAARFGMQQHGRARRSNALVNVRSGLTETV